MSFGTQNNCNEYDSETFESEDAPLAFFNDSVNIEVTDGTHQNNFPAVSDQRQHEECKRCEISLAQSIQGKEAKELALKEVIEMEARLLKMEQSVQRQLKVNRRYEKIIDKLDGRRLEERTAVGTAKAAVGTVKVASKTLKKVKIKGKSQLK